jgi:uncharacterized protein (TIGR02996 family)
MMLDEREAFLEAIESDPYDLSLRKVFADWLDEFGDDADHDKAVEQREWTTEKTVADLGIKKLAAELSITYDEVIELVKELPNYQLCNDMDDRLYRHLYGDLDPDRTQKFLDSLLPLISVEVDWSEVIRDEGEDYYCSC